MEIKERPIKLHHVDGIYRDRAFPRSRRGVFIWQISYPPHVAQLPLPD